jgi:hypothetical protein
MAITRACEATGTPRFSPHGARRRRGSLHYKHTGSLAEVAELLGDSRTVAADHCVYALTDYREIDRYVRSPEPVRELVGHGQHPGQHRIAPGASIAHQSHELMRNANDDQAEMGAPGLERPCKHAISNPSVCTGVRTEALDDDETNPREATAEHGRTRATRRQSFR